MRQMKNEDSATVIVEKIDRLKILNANIKNVKSDEMKIRKHSLPKTKFFGNFNAFNLYNKYI